MYYVEIYLILGLASFIVTLMTEYKELVLMTWPKIVSLLFYCLLTWPYLWVNEYMLTLEDERKAKAEKLKEK
jgi:flagellar biosynthesis protein FliQ